MRILIVDRNIGRLRQLCALVKGTGRRFAEIGCATSANEIEAQLKRDFDAVFIGISADEFKPLVLEMVRQIRISGMTSARIIVYGPAPTKQAVLEAVSSGASSFLTYPFSISDIEHALGLE